MKSFRKTAVAVGLLFLTATATFLAAHTLALGVLGEPGATTVAAEKSGTLAISAVLYFVDALAVALIGFLLFPVLKRYSEPLALGYAGMRIGEFAAVLLLMAPIVLLIEPSVASTPADWAMPAGGADISANASVLSVAGAEYRAAMALVFLCTGAAGTILAWILIRSRLVPRAIAFLGVLGYPAMFLGTVLELFKVLDLQQGPGLLLVWPVGLFELALPAWLIAKGFNFETLGSGA